MSHIGKCGRWTSEMDNSGKEERGQGCWEQTVLDKSWLFHQRIFFSHSFHLPYYCSSFSDLCAQLNLSICAGIFTVGIWEPVEVESLSSRTIKVPLGLLNKLRPFLLESDTGLALSRGMQEHHLTATLAHKIPLEFLLYMGWSISPKRDLLWNILWEMAKSFFF